MLLKRLNPRVNRLGDPSNDSSAVDSGGEEKGRKELVRTNSAMKAAVRFHRTLGHHPHEAEGFEEGGGGTGANSKMLGSSSTPSLPMASTVSSATSSSTVVPALGAAVSAEASHVSSGLPNTSDKNNNSTRRASNVGVNLGRRASNVTASSSLFSSAPLVASTTATATANFTSSSDSFVPLANVAAVSMPDPVSGPIVGTESGIAEPVLTLEGLVSEVISADRRDPLIHLSVLMDVLCEHHYDLMVWYC